FRSPARIYALTASTADPRLRLASRGTLTLPGTRTCSALPNLVSACLDQFGDRIRASPAGTSGLPRSLPRSAHRNRVGVPMQAKSVLIFVKKRPDLWCTTWNTTTGSSIPVEGRGPKSPHVQWWGAGGAPNAAQLVGAKRLACLLETAIRIARS